MAKPRALVTPSLALLAAALIILPRCARRGSPTPAAELGARAATETPADAGSPEAHEPGALPAGSAAAPGAAWSPRRIAKFDMHTHIDPEVYQPARAFLEQFGIGRVVNLSGGTVGQGLEETIAAGRSSGGFYVTFVNIDFEGIGTPGWAAREVKQLERAKALGVRGVKIAKNLGLRVQFPDGRRVPVDDPVLDPLFDAMGRLHLPLAIHTGDPKAFFDAPGPNNERMDELASHPMWSFADRARYPTWEGLYGEFVRRVKRSSGTTIIGVHFGNDPEEPGRVKKMLDECPNFYVDTAARVPEIGRKPEETRRAILAHPDRVLFGTDVQLGMGMMVLGAGEGRGHTRADVEHFFMSSWEFFETAHRGFAHPTPIQGNWTIDGIDLPTDVLEKVYHGNAERLLGLPPTPLTGPGADGGPEPAR
jgi:predicted TIM-barrel fold metal-dependent hydrolase